MFKKLKQKTKNKKEETLNQGGNLQEQKNKNNSNKRLHIIYVLIIINLILWSINYIEINNFYEHYLKLLINDAQAEEKDINKNNLSQPKIKKEKKNPDPSLGSMEWIKQQWIEAGADWKKVYAIIQCESQGDPEAHRVNWKNQAGVDRGLYQISSLHHPEISNSCAYDAICSTKKAIEIYKERGNFSAWTCAKKLSIHK